MINHHPTEQMLIAFVAAELPVSLTAAVAVHAEMCSCCALRIEQLTQMQANRWLDVAWRQSEEPDWSAETLDPELEQMLDAMVLDDAPAAEQKPKAKQIAVAGQQYQLPRALHSLPLGAFSQFGKLSRARFGLDEGALHSSLLYIQPGGGVPQHSHKGFELTLLLSGHFSDADGDYGPGDFILLDGSHTHQPVSATGCLCFTVADAPQRFTQGMNRLLNPIGNFIY
ncbi:ChrR family anti-sigma-E factor [Rheinheimera sp.]|uniref:ChrR family anti-sigma-E factor n=1 Tax=Rheinheimera sp. TaxID=1869214 RepID=UPI003AF79ED7